MDFTVTDTLSSFCSLYKLKSKILFNGNDNLEYYLLLDVT